MTGATFMKLGRAPQKIAISISFLSLIIGGWDIVILFEKSGAFLLRKTNVSLERLRYPCCPLYVLEKLFYAAETSHETRCLVRKEDSLRLIAAGYILEHLNVVLCEEIVGRIGALANRCGNLFDGLCFCLSLTDAL